VQALPIGPGASAFGDTHLLESQSNESAHTGSVVSDDVGHQALSSSAPTDQHIP
jgi:hypothetical protein